VTSRSEYIALEVNGETVSLSDALTLAKLNGKLQFIRDAVDATLIRQAAAERELVASDDELQQAANDFRTARDLHDAGTTASWLEDNHLSQEEWESLLEESIIAAKLREALTAGRVDQHFAEQRYSFDAATLSLLVLAEEDLARELRAQIIEEGSDFHALARKHSIDEATKLVGGYAGSISRTDMEASVEAAVFGGQPGKIVGPLKTDAGWQLVKIESIDSATLDDTMRETIKSLLFDEWLSERRSKARIRVPLLEAEAE
jgi:putative peptide maturation system protein